MRKNPHTCPLDKKAVLSIEECAVVTGIGQNKLKAMLAESDCPFRLMNGRKRMILKDKLMEYLEEVQKI